LFALQHFENIVGDAFRSENTSTLPTVTASASTRIKLHDNLLIIRSLGVTGTPAIIYRTEGGRIKIVMGLISRRRLVAMLPHFK
jgi:protein-disulfide isomerase